VKRFLSSLTPNQIQALFHNWSFLARPEQRPPEHLPNSNEPWQFWLYLAGRGAGKTRSGAEKVREKVKSGCKRIGLIAPTQADIRKVMIEGSSGILSCSWESDVDNLGNPMGRPIYEPSKGHQLTWENGAVAHGYSAEEPDRLRGPQHDFIWADELAAWKNAQEAWDMAMFGLRLGENPQAMISTTPRPIPALREIMRMPTTIVTRSSTYANRVNLAKTFINIIIAKYHGTRLGRQELGGELLEEMEGALWSRDMIEKCMVGPGTVFKVPPMQRIVISVDPAITENPDSNLTGIVAAGLGIDNEGYVLADASGRYSPNDWATQAIALYDSFGADRIVAEGNQGGDMVRHTIQTIRPNAPISIVHASRSKQARAEPVSALYEQNRCHHVKPFTELEDQMCTWEPLSGDPSPDRLDAMVWAFTNLMLSDTVVPFVIPTVVGQTREVPGSSIIVPISPVLFNGN
jgi:phage terminase large subunit-like protein